MRKIFESICRKTSAAAASGITDKKAVCLRHGQDEEKRTRDFADGAFGAGFASPKVLLRSPFRGRLRSSHFLTPLSLPPGAGRALVAVANAAKNAREATVPPNRKHKDKNNEEEKFREH